MCIYIYLYIYIYTHISRTLFANDLGLTNPSEEGLRGWSYAFYAYHDQV